MKRKKTEILLRFDDICPTMNWKQWNKAKDLLDSIGVKALLGVIPDNHDTDLLIDDPRKDFWEYIKSLQEQGFAIAMHGYQHVFDIQASGISTPLKHSEFAGHSYEVQYEKIKRGKDILLSHGIETDVFFAPAHSYDDNTLKGLAANGFKYLSDGLSCKPYVRHGILSIPARSGGIPKINNSGYYTAVIHAHEWARKDKAYAWEQLKQICETKANNIVDFETFRKRKGGNAIAQASFERGSKFLLYKFIPLLRNIKGCFIMNR